MKHLISLIALATVLALACTHKPTTPSFVAPHEPTSAEVSLDHALDEGILGIDLEADAELWKVEAQKFADLVKAKNFAVAIRETCEKNADSPYCKSFELPRYRFVGSSVKGRKVSKKEFSQWLRTNDFETLSGLRLEDLIRNLKGVSTQAILKTSDALLKNDNCYNSSLYTALGSFAENDFPKAESVELVLNLYAKASSCGNDESAARAAYRLGLLYVWQNKCPLAIDQFNKVQKTREVSFLHSRSRYWQNTCEDQISPVASLSEKRQKKLEDFPLSYHTLAYFGDQSDVVFQKVKEQPEPFLQFRTEKAPQWNNPVKAAEALYKIGARNLAKDVLSRLDLNEIEPLEPQFRLYLSLFFHQNQMALEKFRLLSRLFSQSPEYTSITALKIYYPLWYYDVVKDSSNNFASPDLDPFLIISLVRQESAFNPNARSPRGAVGLMQLLPSTARRIASVRKHDLAKPEQNIKAGVKFFNYLLNRYDGKTYLALSAYNAGPLIVDTWLKRYPTSNDLLFMDLIPYRETREYSAIILRNYYWYTRLYQRDYIIETSQPMAKRE